jgi:dihydrofolate synthase/folylpolyglutamate synthase
VLEVGHGGRFDSTNVCEPFLTIITNISYDHMSILGNTIAEIAFEKAGICKRDVPVVTTATHPDALRVIATVAAANDAPVRCLGREFNYLYAPDHPFEPPLVRVATNQRDWGWLPLGLFGEHQASNAAGVVAAIEELRRVGLIVPDRAVRHGMAHVCWPARMELIARSPVVVLDCAHNVASMRALLDTLLLSFPINGVKHLLFAASTDKQIPEMLAILAPVFDVIHLTRYTSNPRSADPAQVAQLLTEMGHTRVAQYATPEEAWHAVHKQLGPNDGVVVTGSVFLAGELRPLLVRVCQ